VSPLNRRQSPWDVLGLVPGCTEREVRSAYARTLKVTRPDDDPVAFQRLVEARDFVLEMIKAGIQPRYVEFEPADGDDGADAAGQRADALLAGAAIDALALEAPVLEAPVPAQAPAIPVPQVIVADVPAPATAPETAVLPAATDENPREIIADILRRLDPDATAAMLADWKTLLARVGQLRHDTRTAIEPAVLRALPVLLPPISRLNGPVAIAPWYVRLDRLIGTPAINPARAIARQQAEMLVALDEEFGWTRFDRHVYGQLGLDDAREVLSRLTGLVQAAAIRRQGLPLRRSSKGIPLLDERDLRAYFGEGYGAFASAYAAARQHDRWTPSWSTVRALMMPFLALSHRLWLPLGCWLASAAFAATAGFARSLHPAWLISLGAWHREAVLALAFAPMVLVHLWYGLFGHVQHLTRAMHAVIEADKRGQFQPEMRYAFIGYRSPSRAKPAAASTGKIPAYVWVMGLLILLRALAAMNSGSHTATGLDYPGLSHTGLPKFEQSLPVESTLPAAKLFSDAQLAKIKAGDVKDVSMLLDAFNARQITLQEFGDALERVRLNGAVK
jgi:hypothetical protein